MIGQTWGTELRIAVVLAVYFATAWIGLHLHSDASASITSIWAPAGIAVGCTLVWGWPMLFGVYLGALLTNLTTGDAGPITALFIGVGNATEALVIACIVYRVVNFDHLKIVDLAKISAAVTVGCAIAASIGTLALHINGVLATSEWAEGWRIWWSGDALGVLVVTPFVLFLLTRRTS